MSEESTPVDIISKYRESVSQITRILQSFEDDTKMRVYGDMHVSHWGKANGEKLDSVSFSMIPSSR